MANSLSSTLSAEALGAEVVPVQRPVDPVADLALTPEDLAQRPANASSSMESIALRLAFSTACGPGLPYRLPLTS